MTAPEPSVPPANEPFPEGTVDAGVYATQSEAFEHSLVVLAMGEACWLVTTDAGHHLRVEAAVLGEVRRQLASFDRESIGWPPQAPSEPPTPRRPLPLSPALWVLSIAAVFRAQGTRHEFTDTWLLDARRVFADGEWWRTASALWLHSDVAHLVSNAGSGLLVFSAVVATFGFRLGWVLLAVSAVAGNVAAVALHHGDDYRSLGASTAVFAALGLLVGRAVRVMGRSRHPHRWRTMLVPLASGLAVLGLFGAGGVNIDVLAHATGFCCGLALGFFAAKSGPAYITSSPTPGNSSQS
jgi:rhomboid protease GluP